MPANRIIVSSRAMHARIMAARKDDQIIGFVPTLGNLHEGHARLMRALRPQCDLLITSIFVNPTQFAEHEDLDTYPRSDKQDLRLCWQEQNDLIFRPAAHDIYVGGQKPLTLINVPTMTLLHCGGTRPHFFPAVLTIVNLLFNIVLPHKAAFGKKDFQQLRLVQIMTKELHLPVEIVPVDTGRAADGLALSSRNQYLTAAERKIAPKLYATLLDLSRRGDTDYRALEEEGMRRLHAHGFKPEYVHVCRADNLQPAQSRVKNAVILAAAWLGRARLIDNVPLATAA